MKILAYIHSNFSGDAAGVPISESLSPKGTPEFYAWADSCRIPTDRPLFLPIFADSFVAVPAMAVKAGKVGKSIPLRFTPRYFLEWAPSLIVLPERDLGDFRAGRPLPAISTCFDGALAIGEWTTVDPLPDPLPRAEYTGNLSARLIPRTLEFIRETISDPTPGKAVLPDLVSPVSFDCSLFPEAFSNISEYNAIKTGDILMIPSDFEAQVDIGTKVSICTNPASEKPALLTRFK